MAEKIRLALLAGGKSGEREVSLQGAAGVEKALDPQKYIVKRYDPAHDLPQLAVEAADIDVAFILLHGKWGEDGTVQGFLDLLDIPYQGAGVLGSAMAMDKEIAKILYRQAGIRVADWLMATEADCQNPEPIIKELGLPVVIKPIRQGSSLGMSIPGNRADLISGLQVAFQHDSEVMVEKFIKGREITVGVIGNDEPQALPLVEIIPADKYQFFDYEAKYQAGASREVCPAQVDAAVADQAQEWGLMAHNVLKLRGYSRTDMIIAADGLYVLETNTIPGMTPTSLLPQAAAEFGLSFADLLDRLIELAMESLPVRLPALKKT